MDPMHINSLKCQMNEIIIIERLMHISITTKQTNCRIIILFINNVYDILHFLPKKKNFTLFICNLYKQRINDCLSVLITLKIKYLLVDKMNSTLFCLFIACMEIETFL